MMMVFVEAIQRHADLLLNVLQLLLQLGGQRDGFPAAAAVLVQLLELALGIDQFVVMVLTDDDEFLGHLLLVIETGEELLQGLVGLDEFLFRLGQVGRVAARLHDLGVHIVRLLVGRLDAADKNLERGEVLVAAVDFLVLDDAVETLAALFQLAGEIEVFLGGEAEAVQMLLHHALGVFDALGDFDFLFTRQQRHLAHLLEIHADGIVQNIELGVGLFLVGKLFVCAGDGLLVAIHVGGIDDVDLQTAEKHDDGFQLFRVIVALRNGFVQIVPSQVALLLGKLDEIADALVALRLTGKESGLSLGVLFGRLGNRLRRSGHGRG